MIPDVKGQAISTALPKKLDVGEQANTFYEQGAVEENLAKEGEGSIFGEAAATSIRGGAKRSRRLKI